MYSMDILDQVRLSKPVIGVDPFPEMLAGIPAGAPITPVAMDALQFSSQPGSYDKIFMKEAIHHIDDRATLLSALFARLRPGGRLLLVHVPPKLDYPLFRRALDRAERWHADPDELAALLERAGFAVDRDFVEIRHAIPTATYFRMVESRYMSVLSSFGPDDIESGLGEMREQYGSLPVLEFTDHFDYITGIRPA